MKDRKVTKKIPCLSQFFKK